MTQATHSSGISNNDDDDDDDDDDDNNNNDNTNTNNTIFTHWLIGSSVSLQGMSLPPLFHYSLLGFVAVTLIALFIITRVCRCHPSCSHLAGCVAANPILC